MVGSISRKYSTPFVPMNFSAIGVNTRVGTAVAIFTIPGRVEHTPPVQPKTPADGTFSSRIPAPPAATRRFVRRSLPTDGTGAEPGLSPPRPPRPWTGRFRAGEPETESAGRPETQGYCCGCRARSCYGWRSGSSSDYCSTSRPEQHGSFTAPPPANIHSSDNRRTRRLLSACPAWPSQPARRVFISRQSSSPAA